MRILGIDPGYAIVGYGVIDYNASRFTTLEYGAVTTEAGTKFSLRLEKIYDDVSQIIERTGPDALSIEKLFFNTNTTTAIDVAQARGVILLAAKKQGIPIYEYTPLQVKQSMVGYGRAEKTQVQEMTKMFLHLDKIPKPDDAADALALAICHGHASSSLIMNGRF
jgi:crossover junction endodeoxyribonuclease RuvC